MSEWPAPEPLVDTDGVSGFDLNEPDVVTDASDTVIAEPQAVEPEVTESQPAEPEAVEAQADEPEAAEERATE